MILIAKRGVMLLVMLLFFVQCAQMVGDFQDCKTNVDCWETYARNDLICSESQCVRHELQDKCETIIGDTDENTHDGEVITFGAIIAVAAIAPRLECWVSVRGDRSLFAILRTGQNSIQAAGSIHRFFQPLAPDSSIQ